MFDDDDDEECWCKHPKTMKHPMQNLVWDKQGVIRFQENKIVRFLLDAGPFDMNQLACMDFDTGDREQFAMLIGYSQSGASELSYVSDELYEKSCERVEEMIEEKDTAGEAYVGTCPQCNTEHKKSVPTADWCYNCGYKPLKLEKEESK